MLEAPNSNHKSLQVYTTLGQRFKRFGTIDTHSTSIILGVPYKTRCQLVWRIRPYIAESTGSRPISKVKLLMARSVVSWETRCESLVLYFCFFPLSLSVSVCLDRAQSLFFVLYSVSQSVSLNCNLNLFLYTLSQSQSVSFNNHLTQLTARQSTPVSFNIPSTSPTHYNTRFLQQPPHSPTTIHTSFLQLTLPILTHPLQDPFPSTSTPNGEMFKEQIKEQGLNLSRS